MKVYKMNECDWVAAESEKQAKEFYKLECGFEDEEIDQDFEGEVSLEDTMYVLIDDLPLDEQKNILETFRRDGELFVSRSFAWVIQNEKITSPCIIASTEY